MSQSLMNLIKAYGDARTDWDLGRVNRVPETLAVVRGRIEDIRDAAILGVDVDETISALLDGTE